jgi:phosphoglycerol transferase
MTPVVSTPHPAQPPITEPVSARWLNARARTFGQYLTALALCLLVLGAVFDLRSEARQWPFAYGGDTMFYQLVTKSVVDHGWFLDVPSLGAPDTLDLRDAPISDDNLHVLMLWVLSLGTSHYPTVLNNFFLLGFPLVFLCALWVLRHFGVAWWTSVCVSLLYTFAPFHILRGEHHLFLSAYWPVPLAVLVTLWVSRDGLWPDGTGRPTWRSRRLWLSVLICAVLAATGFYYAFFACYFLFIASLVAAVRRRRWRALWPGLGLVAVIAVGVCINLLPTLLRFQEEGSVQVVRRFSRDADTYGLRIAQLLLPVRGHRLEPLQDLRAEYARRPLINENDDVSLGFAGALGFVGLLWWFFFLKPAAEGANESPATGLLHHLGIFNLAGVLLGTMGGFGSLVAFFGLPQVRAYNRIVTFLSFFAFFALALWLDRVARRYAATRTRAIGWGCALAIVTVLALYDQISPKALPDYDAIRAQFASDATFVQEIESNVPHGAMIFQLPVMVFPEGQTVPEMMGYDLLRGYLHSDHLRWSYGTVRGRAGHSWLRYTAALPPDQLVETLAWAGFSGIYIGRNGFTDGGRRIEMALGAVLGGVPLVSPDERLVFYNLKDYRARLEQLSSRGEWASKREAALHPPLAVWREGFSDEEGAPAESWRWGASKARMTLVNRAAYPRDFCLQMTVLPNPGGSVTIRSALFDEPVHVERNRPQVDKVLRLPPGQYDVHFDSDAPRVYPLDDFRVLVFSVRDFRVSPVARPLADSPSVAEDPRECGSHVKRAKDDRRASGRE